MDKIKVYNKKNFDVGVVMQDKPMGMNIKPNSFMLMTKDEIEYISSISDLFAKGVLIIDELNVEAIEKLGLEVGTDPNAVTADEVKKKLSGKVKTMTEWLEDITEDYVLDMIFDTAKGMNLSADKLKALQAKMPNHKFIDD